MAKTVQELLALTKDIPPGSWVVLDSDEGVVLSWGQDVAAMVGDARSHGVEAPYLLRVPEQEQMLFL